MSQNEGFALLIGVDDYSVYDQSVGNPGGKSNLLGSRNDVLAFFRTCRDLDIPAENVRVLTSPKMDAGALPGVPAANIGEATEQAIIKGAAWLADALGAGGGAGLLTFSGHGERLGNDELAICPADTAGEKLERAISFGGLRRIFAQKNALAGLTCVIDACFAGAARTALDASAPRERRMLSLGTGAARAAGELQKDAEAPPAIDLGDRVLAASGPDQAAFQARFSGEHRGAFSWAVGTTLDQWSRVGDSGGKRSSLSYGELRARSERLLETLSFEQKPVLHGPSNVADLAFLQRGSVPKITSREPDAPRLALQLDPGFHSWVEYTFTLNLSPTPVLVAKVFAMYQTVSSFTAGNEYWYVDEDQERYLGGASLTITATDHSSGTPSPPSFTNTQSFVESINLTWVTMTNDPGSGGVLYQNGNIYLRINDDAGTPPKVTTVTWYQVLTTGVTPANITPSGTFTTASTVSVGARETAHYVAYGV